MANIQLKDLGVGTRLVLKAITVMQKALLKSNTKAANDLYYWMAKKHFSIFFKGTKSLEKEVLADTEDAYKAARRHSRLVIAALYSDSDDIRKRMVRAAARGAFFKNILLNMEL